MPHRKYSPAPPLLAFLFTGLWAAAVAAHGGRPLVVEVDHPPHAPDALWVVVDNVGLMARVDGRNTWLCDDAVMVNGGLAGLAAVDGGRVMVAATRFGVLRSTDGGCSFDSASAVLAEHVAVGVLQHPARPEELLTITQTLGIPNDVFRSTDGGATWTPAGLQKAGRVRTIVRAQADPEVVYITHVDGAARSDDGGASFVDIALGPAELEVQPQELRMLTGHPDDAATIYAAVERFPEYWLVRSRDAGATWEAVHQAEDAPDSLAIHPDGQRMMFSSLFDGAWRSEDGGATWARAPETPNTVLGCLTWDARLERLWACTDSAGLVMAPWVLGYSEDFGLTWQGEIASFADIDALWRCPDDAPTTEICSGVCTPGDPSCSDAGVSADAGGADAAPADAGVVDAARMTARPDAGPTPTRSGGGCFFTSGNGGAVPSVLLLVLLAFGRRRLL